MDDQNTLHEAMQKWMSLSKAQRQHARGALRLMKRWTDHDEADVDLVEAIATLESLAEALEEARLVHFLFASQPVKMNEAGEMLYTDSFVDVIEFFEHEGEQQSRLAGPFVLGPGVPMMEAVRTKEDDG